MVFGTPGGRAGPVDAAVLPEPRGLRDEPAASPGRSDDHLRALPVVLLSAAGLPQPGGGGRARRCSGPQGVGAAGHEVKVIDGWANGKVMGIRFDEARASWRAASRRAVPSATRWGGSHHAGPLYVFRRGPRRQGCRLRRSRGDGAACRRRSGALRLALGRHREPGAREHGDRPTRHRPSGPGRARGQPHSGRSWRTTRIATSVRYTGWTPRRASVTQGRAAFRGADITRETVSAWRATC